MHGRVAEDPRRKQGRDRRGNERNGEAGTVLSEEREGRKGQESRLFSVLRASETGSKTERRRDSAELYYVLMFYVRSSDFLV